MLVRAPTLSSEIDASVSQVEEYPLLTRPASLKHMCPHCKSGDIVALVGDTMIERLKISDPSVEESIDRVTVAGCKRLGVCNRLIGDGGAIRATE